MEGQHIFSALCSSKLWFLWEGKFVLPYFKCWSRYFFKSVLKILGTSLEVLPHDRLSKKGINPPYINGWWNVSSVKKTPLVFYQFLSRGRYLQNRSLSSYTKRSHSSTAKRWIWPGLPREKTLRVPSLHWFLYIKIIFFWTFMFEPSFPLFLF